MNIGLIDVDGHNFPNLPLMKLSAWHKSQGDSVEWCIPMMRYDRVYMSKVFDFTPDIHEIIQADEVIKGGTGYVGGDNMKSDKHYDDFIVNGQPVNVVKGEGNTYYQKVMPEAIEHIYPDYGLYPQHADTAYGFLTRGCPNACEFCIVTQKEGRKSVKVADLSEFWRGQKKIVLLDPNMLACREHTDLLKQLIDSKAKIDFSQGVDIRLTNDDNINLISQCKIDMIHFAWDYMKNSKIIVRKLKRFKELTGIDERRARVYVLTNFDTTMDENLYRVYKLREMGYDPYVMVYDKHKAPKEVKRLQRWVNNKFIFRTCERFEDYDPKKG